MCLCITCVFSRLNFVLINVLVIWTACSLSCCCDCLVLEHFVCSPSALIAFRCINTRQAVEIIELFRWCRCSSVGRSLDWHVTEAGLISWCGKGFFFPQSQLSAQTLMVSVHPPCATACINICAHVRARWIMETLRHPACSTGWVARLCCSWLSPGKSNPNFPWEKS